MLEKAKRSKAKSQESECEMPVFERSQGEADLGGGPYLTEPQGSPIKAPIVKSQRAQA